jgi:hypothetical protein
MNWYIHLFPNYFTKNIVIFAQLWGKISKITRSRAEMSLLDLLGVHFDPNILVTLGVVLVVTFLGSKIFQRLGIPRVA